VNEKREFGNFEIPQPTLAAAQILDYDPQTLMGLYDSDFFYEVEDNQVVTTQMHEIYQNLGIFFDSGKEELKGKITRAMETDPLFKNFVFDFLLEECANQIVSDTSCLNDETFKGVIELIKHDKDLKKKLEESIEMTKRYQEESAIVAEQHILQIKISLDRILQENMDKLILEPTSLARIVHRIVLKVTNGAKLEELDEKERWLYEDHINDSNCAFCAIIKRRGFSDFQEFSDFILDTREFKTIVDKTREYPKPRPLMN
jgi:hypothetical protein